MYLYAKAIFVSYNFLITFILAIKPFCTQTSQIYFNDVLIITFHRLLL